MPVPTDNTDAADTSAAADSSTNEETTDTEDDVDLNADNPFEDIEVDESDETEESDSDDSEEDSAASEDADTEENSEEDEDKDDSDSEETEEESTDEEEKTEVDPKEQARLAYQERQREKAAEEAHAKAKKEKQDKYLEGAKDEQDLALRQLQVDAYNNRIEKTTTKLETGLERAVAGIDLFRTGTPAVKQKLVRAVEQFDALYVKKDSNGDPIEVTGDLVQYLNDEADSIRDIMGDGATQQTSDKSKQKARTVTPPVKAPKKAKADPGLDAFDLEAAK